MPCRLTGLLLGLALILPALAQEKVGPEKAAPPAVSELLLPAGAPATADDKDLADLRLVTLTDLKPTEVRRVKLAVTFVDGTKDERLVDVAAGQRLPIAVPQPGPEKVTVFPVQTLGPITASAMSR